MPGKIYFYLLILCGTWSHGIIRTFADENKESSDFLDRQKRVISYVPGEDKTTGVMQAPYVVIIKHNRRINCVGSILSHYVAITITRCVRSPASEYEVYSSTSRTDHGIHHNVLRIIRKFGELPSRNEDGIALLTVDPPFVFRGRYSRFIELHSGPLLPDTLGIISGWGYNTGSDDHGTSIRKNLRTITVRVIDHRQCVNIYQPHNIEISDKDICTYHPQRHCGHSDGGAPLVIDGYLAGVHLWTGPNRSTHNCEYPDVFAILQHSVYSQWIRSSIHNIEAQFNYHD